MVFLVHMVVVPEDEVFRLTSNTLTGFIFNAYSCQIKSESKYNFGFFIGVVGGHVLSCYLNVPKKWKKTFCTSRLETKESFRDVADVRNDVSVAVLVAK